MQILHNLYFSMENEEELVDTYRFHSYLAILRFISYSQPARPKHLWQNFFYFFKIVFRGDPGRAWCSLKRQAVKAFKHGRKIDLVQHIKNNFQSPTVVDYGCGLAFTSFRIGRIQNLLDSSEKNFFRRNPIHVFNGDRLIPGLRIDCFLGT